MFDIVAKDPRSAARTGRIHTQHGDIETPAYVIVATNGAVRTLDPEDIPATNTQVVISNTYHLWRSLGDSGLADYPGLHETMEWQGPIMTDSGGFQVFSLGVAREHGTGKTLNSRSRHHTSNDEERAAQEDEERGGMPNTSVRVTEAGVYFEDGRGDEAYLDAEYSMKIQEELGGDIIFAFDEPSSPLHDHAYAKAAMERTHRWAERSLEAKISGQLLFGIVQGGAFEDLRRESAAIIGRMPFAGYGIGGSFGSSFGGEESSTANELSWTVPLLPERKPRHLLGMGRITDIFTGVAAGIDTFDCVIPTREARHGKLWTVGETIDIHKGKYAGDEGLIDPACACPTCAGKGISRGELRALFKDRNPAAGRLATMHNIYFFNDLMAKIREAIPRGELDELKKRYLPGV